MRCCAWVAAGDVVFGARHLQDIGVTPAPDHAGQTAVAGLKGPESGAARRRRDSSS